MSKRQTPASIVVDFFTTAPLSEATLLLGIVRGTMKRRLAATQPIAPAVRKVRKPRVNAKPTPQPVSPLVGEVHA
jgi:hypothetical protein